jgi:hypothetical protein
MICRSIALTLIMITQTALAADPATTSQSVLQSLAGDFEAARALPVGSRPVPPDIELRKLVGMKWSIVRAALGSPDVPDDYDWQCHAKKCEVYSYGANERQADKPETGEDGNGLQWVSVTTGGPWVLILGVSLNKVISARWQGQK